MQVAAGQGAHGHGRGRHRCGDGQPLSRGQLAGALPRHHARREDAQPLAHGPAARAGGADRVRELEDWGALFDRTPDGLISQRDFGGHRYARLAHVGDRTGLELIRTLQQRTVALGIDVYMECTVTRPLTGDDGITGAFGYWRESGRFVALAGAVGRARHRRDRQVLQGDVELVGVHRRRHSLALQAGASLVNMEFVQFHPTGMVWPPSVRGILVTESVRGDGGILKNSRATASCSTTSPTSSARRRRRPRPRPTAGTTTRRTTGAPGAAPRDEVARAINSEVKAGRGTPHGGVFLDIASRRLAEYIRKRLPSMYHQFKELAEVDITAERWRSGPPATT